jgi:hypothetical protein
MSNQQTRYRYPAIGLRDAVEKVEALFHKEHRNPMSPETVVHHLGYGSLNGASVRTLSALKKYGLLEGRGNDLVISNDAITIIADKAVEDQADRAAALEKALIADSLFGELRNRFGDQVSEVNVTSYLVKKGFNPDSAKRASASFLDSLTFVKEQVNDYNLTVQEEQALANKDERDKTGGSPMLQEAQSSKKAPLNQLSACCSDDEISVFTFDLDEGRAVIQWPRNLSQESVTDLEDFIAVIMRKEKRKAASSGQSAEDKD